MPSLSYYETLLRSIQKTMGKGWQPTLDAPTQACLQELPWWSGYNEASARAQLLADQPHLASGSGGVASTHAAQGKQGAGAGPAKPLPHITHDHFVHVLRPQLFKCPRMGGH